ncbi:hypothetical protein OV203_01045 [Nannocystis sp. ILAH1]|uniref:hypothetical protein n=2 Tax=unclassified Nannocystis TaxID=2627009 RepID=UPI00226DB79B|nr:hypothetical protein [Nannocystis sp. ILAH1]MCY0985697.1 hypothetical protein [Nannocystis sp. ILAH1]
MMIRNLVGSFLVTLSLAGAPFLTGCAGSRASVITPEEVQTHGTYTFTAPPAEVFAATLGALKTLGYPIAVTNEEKGIIKTERKFIRAMAVGGNYSAQAIDFTRQYYLRLESSDGASTSVTADPKVYMGERDVSGDKVWVLEGPEGERELWKRLFTEIQSNL